MPKIAELPKLPAATATTARPHRKKSPAVIKGQITRIALDAFFPLQQSGSALIYDARPSLYYHLGHIPGAISFPRHSSEAELIAHEPEIAAARAAHRPVILYCTDLACPDAYRLATRLAARGHSITILEGGWATWKAADFPTE